MFYRDWINTLAYSLSPAKQLFKQLVRPYRSGLPVVYAEQQLLDELPQPSVQLPEIYEDQHMISQYQSAPEYELPDTSMGLAQSVGIRFETPTIQISARDEIGEAIEQEKAVDVVPALETIVEDTLPEPGQPTLDDLLFPPLF